MSITMLMVGTSTLSPQVTNAGAQPVVGDNSLVTMSHPNDPLLSDINVLGTSQTPALGVNILSSISADTNPLTTLTSRSIAFQITTSAGISAGVLTFEASNDSTNWFAVPVIDAAAPSTAAVTTLTLVASTSRYFMANILFKYFRARVSTAVAGGTVQAFTELLSSPLPGIFTAGVSAFNLTQIAGTGVVNAGVAGVMSVGGNIAVGTARTINPAPVGGVDINNLTRVGLFTVDGKSVGVGPGEVISQFSLGTGAAAVTDGTNGKTWEAPLRESDVYLDFSAISTTPTIQLEGSYDGVLFFIIPLSRIDNTAASQLLTAQAAFTPVVGAIYRGRNYGAPILRVHLTAGSASNTIGIIRITPLDALPGATVSAFALTATNTTESVGIANGQIFTGGVRTLAINNKGSVKAELILEGITGTLTYALEGSNDNANWNALPMQPKAGGPTVTSVAATGTAALPQIGFYESDISNYTFVRVHCTAWTSGVAFGALKIIPVGMDAGTGNSTKASYSLNINGAAPTTANYVLATVEASATRKTILKKMTIWNSGAATAAQRTVFSIVRQTTAGSGTAGTAVAMETTDAFGGIVRIPGSTGGTLGAVLYQFSLWTPAAVANFTPFVIDFTNGGTKKGIVILPGVANGIYFRNETGGAGYSAFDATFEFTEE